MWIGYESPSSLEETEQEIKLAMNFFIIIICIKNYMTAFQALMLVGLSLLNQTLLDSAFLRE